MLDAEELEKTARRAVSMLEKAGLPVGLGEIENETLRGHGLVRIIAISYNGVKILEIYEQGNAIFCRRSPCAMCKARECKNAIGDIEKHLVSLQATLAEEGVKTKNEL